MLFLIQFKGIKSKITDLGTLFGKENYYFCISKVVKSLCPLLFAFKFLQRKPHYYMF